MTYLDYQQLLPNSTANCPTCVLDVADSEYIQVQGDQDRHNRVAQ